MVGSACIKTIQISIVIVLILSCSRNENSKIKSLPNCFSETEFSMDSLFSDIRFIPLSSEIPISQTEDIIWYDSLFYISTYAGRIFSFNELGQLKESYCKQGRGPDEYGNIVNFIIIEDSIYINSGVNKKIKVYDLHLDFQRDIPYPKGFTSGDITYLDSTIFLFSRTAFKKPLYDWLAINRYGKVIGNKVYNGSDISPCWESSNSSIQTISNNIIYHYRIDADTIFRIISPKKEIPFLLIDREYCDGTKMYSQSELGTTISMDGRREIRKILEIGNRWLIMYFINKRPAITETVLFDPISNKSQLVSRIAPRRHYPFSIGIPFDWLGTGYLNPRLSMKINLDMYVVCLVSAYEIIQFTNSESFENCIPTKPEVKNKLLEFSKTISIDDNPVLILLKLR